MIMLSFSLTAFAADYNTPGNDSMTAISDFQNATVYVPVDGQDGLINIGEFYNATVYVGGGANGTISEGGLNVFIGCAKEMGYKDLYLYCYVPYGFDRASFDYELYTGNKSNILLIELMGSKPNVTVSKSSLIDDAAFGIGVWSYIHEQIGGLNYFPQGKHHVEIITAGDGLILSVDGKCLATSDHKQHSYLVIHLMTGDGDSFIRGTITNLSVSATALPLSDPEKNKTGQQIITPCPAPGKVSPSAAAPILNQDNDDNSTGKGATNQLSGIGLWLAVAAGAGFLIAWAFIYFKYLKD
ncbi:hypothetical protein [Methanooceanicella nereidis]|nr:hypothetical protein [Methanocella sp. CWC-04]